MTAKREKKKKNHSASEEIKDPLVVCRRKSGGTLIESPAVFSADRKHIFVNSGWGARVFSLKTGECVRVLDLPRNDERVVSVFTYSSHPYCLTSNYSLIKWDQKSGKVLSDVKLNSRVLNKTVCQGGLLCQLHEDSSKQDLCLLIKCKKTEVTTIQFFSILTGNLVPHPWSGIRVKDGKHTISFGGANESRIMACIDSIGLTVHSLLTKEKSSKYCVGKEKEWICVQCHPTEDSVAVGDSLGRVILIKDPFGHSGGKTIFHWHTLPVNVIAFSPAGSMMYSGGGEHTLVKWNMDNQNIRNYLPRLSAPIVHITISSDNNLLVVSTADNGIILVDSTNKLKCVMQQLAWGVIRDHRTQLFPAGLEYDSRTKSLVLNSRPGHLQFFQPDTETFLLGMDVTQLNYLTQERDKVIVNTDIVKTCFSSDAAWLATVEMRSEPSCSLELKLKFWLYDVLLHKFALNTVIDLPHNGEIGCLKFGPGRIKLFMSETPDTRYLVVTTGTDGKFRFWTPQEIDSVHKKGVSWNCQAVGSYKQKSCSYASFSQDGSLLAVAFEQSLTIWFVGSLSHRATLSKQNEPIKQIEFGREETAHLVVVCTDTEVMVWNLITLSLLWSAKVAPSFLVVDPVSPFMALFSLMNYVYIFNPVSASPVYICRKICGRNSSVLSARFVPREIPISLNKPKWLQKSTLYYLESNQELKCLECKLDEAKHSIDIVEDEEKGTVFLKLIAEQITRESSKSDKSSGKPLHFGTLGRKAVHKVLMAPAHTMPPMSLLCSSILETLAHHKRGKKGDSNLVVEEKEETPMEVASSDSEAEVSQPQPLRGATVIHDVVLPLEVAENPMETNDLFVVDVNPSRDNENDEDLKDEDIENFSFRDL